MHAIEPFYLWRYYYTAEDDEWSPFYGRQYSEFYFSNSIYNYVIHPQWDEFGSPTLYVKILFTNYDDGYSIIEFIGEWNDCLHNDIMFLKREVIEVLQSHGINKFILIGENILNYHSSEDSYYQEWFDEIEEGWIAAINFRDHVTKEFCLEHIDTFITFDGNLNSLEWRTYIPEELFKKVNSILTKRLTA